MPIREIRIKQRLIAEKLRQQGRTQEEASKIAGIEQGTLSKWENGNVSNDEIVNAYPVPDLRVSIPKTEYSKILEMARARAVVDSKPQLNEPHTFSPYNPKLFDKAPSNSQVDQGFRSI